MGIAEADHYAILGVDTDATPAEIRRAFRQLALQFHPDRAGVDSTPVFQRIARAYAVLSDAAARAVHDARRHERVGGPTRSSATTHPGFRPPIRCTGITRPRATRGRRVCAATACCSSACRGPSMTWSRPGSPRV